MLADLAYWQIRVGIWLMGLFFGYRWYQLPVYDVTFAYDPGVTTVQC